MNRLWLAFGFLAWVSATAAQAADQTFQIAVGQQATLELAGNPSTGYRWAIDANASSNLSILHIKDRGLSRNAGGKNLLGAPGIHRWDMQAASSGSARMIFVYRRPWETTVARRHQVAVESTAR